MDLALDSEVDFISQFPFGNILLCQIIISLESGSTSQQHYSLATQWNKSLFSHRNKQGNSTSLTHLVCHYKNEPVTSV